MARARRALAMTDHSTLLLEALTDLGHTTVLRMQLDFTKYLATPVVSRLCDEKGLSKLQTINSMTCSDR